MQEIHDKLTAEPLGRGEILDALASANMTLIGLAAQDTAASPHDPHLQKTVASLMTSYAQTNKKRTPKDSKGHRRAILRNIFPRMVLTNIFDDSDEGRRESWAPNRRPEP